MEKNKKIQLVIGIAAVFLCGIAYLVLGPGGGTADADSARETEFVAGNKQDSATSDVSKTDISSSGVSASAVYIYINSDNVIVNGADGVVADSVTVDDGRVNINTAGAEELKSIPGIGDSKANSIVKYRSEHGRFKKIEDLMQITGIKQGIFNKIKDHIKV